MKRILFIDLVRAYAILSMIQGHLISGVIADIYQDSSSVIYSSWNFNRGITAPVFFFISGLIFSYLLFKNNNKFNENIRVKKGIKRGLKLIGIGYLLQFNVSFLVDIGSLNILDYQSMFMSHVLHCIGVGILFVVGIYYIHDKIKIPFPFLMFIAAFGFFLMDPISKSMSWIHLFPMPVATYFNKDFGSIFPVIPWTGFVAWGSLFGYLIYKFPKLISNKYLPFIMIGLSYLFKIYRYEIFQSVYMITKSDTINAIIHYDYTFYHLPHVIIVVSIFMIISNFAKTVPAAITKIGQNTLFIYVIHVLILYGSTFYKGIVPRFKDALNPWEAILLAIITEAMIIFITLNKEKISEYISGISLRIPFTKKQTM